MSDSECPMIIRDVSDHGFVWTNPPFEAQVGFGATALREKPLVEWIDNQDRQGFERLVREGRGCMRARHQSHTGAYVYVDWEVRSEEHGLVALGTLPARADSATAPSDASLDAGRLQAVPGFTLPETLRAMALILEDQHPGRLCSILLLNPDRRRISVGAGPSLPRTYNAAVEGLEIGPFVGSCGTAAYWNRPVNVRDVQQDPLWRNLRTAAEAAGVAACWSHPIRSQSGLVLGAMALYATEPGRPSPHEQSSLALASSMVALAIERGRAEEALRNSETALRASEDRFRVTFEDASVGIAHVAADGQWMRVNKYLCALLDYSAEELQACRIQDIAYADDLEALHAESDAVLAGDSDTFALECRFVRKGGQVIWVNHTARLLRNAEGEPTYFISVSKNISRRRQANRLVELQSAVLKSIATGAELTATLNLLCRLLEYQLPQARSMILLFGESGERLRAAAGPNMPRQILSAMDGITAEESEGTCAAAAFLERQVITSDIETEPSWAKSLPMTRRFGIRASWSTPLRSQSGAVLGTVSACHNEPALPTEFDLKLIQTAAHLAGIAAEQERREDALRRTQKLESLGLMAGGIAHDFNNLLVAMLGQSSLALAKAPHADPSRDHIQKAVRAAERAAELTNELLAYSGRGHFEFRSLDLNAAVSENLHIFDVAIPKGVRITTELDRSLPTIQADTGQIQQVLMNLVINAAESIEGDGGEVSIRTRTEQIEEASVRYGQYVDEPLAAGRYIVIEIQDTGCGMDHPTLRRIFDPFFTTKSTGRGLGLAAVLGIVRGHAGGLLVNSQLGSGTLFSIVLPTDENDGAPAAVKAIASSRIDGAQGRVLVIDDEASVRESVLDFLSFAGMEVICAESGAQGLALYAARPDEIDLVILDLSMPEMSGEETLHRLRALDPDVRVLLSSGFDESEVTRRFAGSKIAGFMQKPYRPSGLVDTVRAVLE